MAHPLLIGAGVIAAAALGWALLGGKAKAAPPISDAALKAAALTKAKDEGCQAGFADATADASSPHNPRPMLNYSELPDVQAAYATAYGDCYDKEWKGPAVVKETTVVDKVPRIPGTSYPLTKDGACSYGASRGAASGKAAAIAGEDNDPESKLTTAGSLQRQKDCGSFGADYRSCYVSNFKGAYATEMGFEAANKSTSELGKGTFGWRRAQPHSRSAALDRAVARRPVVSGLDCGPGDHTAVGGS